MKNDAIIRDIAYQTDTTNLAAKEFLEALAITVKEALLGDDSEITLPHIGKFSLVAVPARCGRNPKTGEAIDIPASMRIKFKPAASLRDAVNRPIVPERHPATNGSIADSGTVRLGAGCITGHFPPR